LSAGEDAKRRKALAESQRLKGAADEERRKRVVRRFRAGDTVQEIASSMGKSGDYVIRTLRSVGLELPEREPKRKALTQVISEVRAQE